MVRVVMSGFELFRVVMSGYGWLSSGYGLL